MAKIVLSKSEFKFLGLKSFIFMRSRKIYLDVVFCVDATSSMTSTINAAKKKCISIINSVKEENPSTDLMFGACFYRDPIDSKEDVNELFPLSRDEKQLQLWMLKQNAIGGGDSPEDWAGCFNLVLQSIGFRRNSAKLIIHFADSCAHGIEFCGKNNHNDQGPILTNLVQDMARSGIEIRGLSINNGANYTFMKISEIYRAVTEGGEEPTCSYEILNLDNIKETEGLLKMPPETIFSNHIKRYSISSMSSVIYRETLKMNHPTKTAPERVDPVYNLRPKIIIPKNKIKKH